MAFPFAEKGLRVLQNGYQVIPIKPGEKAPAIDNFLHINADAAQIKKWQANGFAGHGVGIVTGRVVMLDLDVPNAAVKKLHYWCIQNLGFGLVRVGQAPKIGLIFRTNSPFPTRMSRTYRDKQGRRCRIEILGLGRQFVAFHTHPDTGLPYYYPEGGSPENTRVDELQLVTWAEIEPLFAYFDQVAEEEGWTRVGNQLATQPQSERNEFIDPKQPVMGDLSDDQVREILMGVPNDERFDPRDDWLQVGFAVHHQTGGSEVGREMWYEWSEQHPSHDDGLFEKAWNSFGGHAADPNYAEITFRFVHKIYLAFRKEELKKQLDGFHFDIDVARNLEDLKRVATGVCLIKDIDKLDREQLASEIQQRAKRLNIALPIRLAREMVRYHETEIDVPKWLEGWVFLKHTGQFYNRSTGEYIDRGAFDTAFSRYVPPDTTPTQYATRIAELPVYHMTMYLPGEDTVFRDTSGLDWINTYRDTSPPMPLDYSEGDLRNIEIVKHHARHLFESEHDIAILHSTLAYIVQTGKRVNWMTILQGAEGIGKTFYSELVAAVLGGPPHVYKLDTETLTGSTFTEWAEGHQVVFIEELKVHGKRYDVMNKLKTYVTDAAVSIHPKGVRQYNSVNTTSYLAFTNHRDAVPLERGDTRYFVMLSRWQSEREAKAFRAANPRYYDRLFDTLQESPGAIRRWLMEYELHQDFNPVARAPYSADKEQVIEESKPELQVEIEDMIESGEVLGVSDDLVVVHLLRDALADDSGVVPTPESIRSVLQKLQFTPIRGRRVKISDKRQGVRQDFYCWSNNPQILATDPMDVRAIIMRDIIK